MSDADDQLRSLIDRVLRLKEEQDALAADIRDIYAEAKGNGFDKTAMGALVAELRRKGKDVAKFEEGNAILDLYREAYDRASHTRAYAREKSPVPRPSVEPAPAPRVKTIADYRPHCLNPSACAASGLRHCHTCAKAAGLAPSEAA